MLCETVADPQARALCFGAGWCCLFLLKYHIQKIHKERKPSKCEICDVTLLDSARLKLHIETVAFHESEEYQFIWIGDDHHNKHKLLQQSHKIRFSIYLSCDKAIKLV